MKILKTAVLILLLINVFTLPTWAITPLQERLDAKLTTAPTKAATLNATRLTKIQQRADTMIIDRITSLQNLLTHLSDDKKLSSDETTTLTTEINTAISNLQTLKAKIDADTDAVTALSDTKTIITSYHVYAIFEPQIRLLLIVDNLSSQAAKLQTLTTQIQSLADTLKSQGKDTTAINTALSDINTQLTTITTKLTADQTTLTSVTVTEDIATAEKTFTQVRQDLATVRQAFAKIRSDFASIRSSFKIILPKAEVTLKPTEPSSSESAK